MSSISKTVEISLDKDKRELLEKAIKTIKDLLLKIEPPTDTQLGWLETWVYKEDVQDLRMAIKLLQQESASKNNLGVDCISRAEVNQVIEDYMDEQYHVLSDRTRERAFGAKVVMARINELPSVTPQEQRKGEWLRMSDLSEQEDDRYKCSRCGNVIHYKDKMDLYTFNSCCGRCGSDNGRHINYEVVNEE